MHGSVGRLFSSVWRFSSHRQISPLLSASLPRSRLLFGPQTRSFASPGSGPKPTLGGSAANKTVTTPSSSSATSSETLTDLPSWLTLPSKKETAKGLLSLLRKEYAVLTLSAGLLVVSTAANMAFPMALGRLVDAASSSLADGSHNLDGIWKVASLLGPVFVVGGAAFAARGIISGRSGERMIQTLRSNIYAHVLRAPMILHDHTPSGGLVARISTDAAVVGRLLADTLPSAARLLLQATAGTALMIYHSPLLAAVLVVSLIPVMSVALGLSRSVRKKSLAASDSNAALAALLNERLSHIRVIRSFGAERLEEDAFQQAASQAATANAQSLSASAILGGAASTCGNGAMLAVLGVGAGQVAQGLLTTGELASILLFTAYVGMSLGGLSSLWGDGARALGAAQRLWALQQFPPAASASASASEEALSQAEHPSHPPSLPWTPPAGSLALSLQAVSLSYDSEAALASASSTSSLALRNVSLQVGPGEIVALVGPSGSGKSSVAQLACGFYHPTEGSVTVWGSDPAVLTEQGTLSQALGYVPQDAALLSGSLARNVAYADLATLASQQTVPTAVTATATETATTATLFSDKQQKALQAAAAWQFAGEKGAESPVGPGGSFLSGGQRARIALARALYQEPPLLILDEATAALDGDSRRLVHAALEAIKAERKHAMLVISHEYSTVLLADRVVVMQDGQIYEEGGVKELLAKTDSLFAQLMKQKQSNPA